MDTNRKDTARYDDLLKRERPESGKYRKMTNSERAAQFAPFAALTGFGKIIRETAERENRDENPASAGEDTE